MSNAIRLVLKKHGSNAVDERVGGGAVSPKLHLSADQKEAAGEKIKTWWHYMFRGFQGCCSGPLD